MNTELTKQQIAYLLETLQQQYDHVRMNEDKLPQIKLDILLDEIRNLYRPLLHLLKEENEGTAIANTQTVSEEKKVEQPKVAEVKTSESVKEEIIAQMESRHDEIKTAGVIVNEIKPESVEEKISIPVEQKIIDER